MHQMFKNDINLLDLFSSFFFSPHFYIIFNDFLKMHLSFNSDKTKQIAKRFLQIRFNTLKHRAFKNIYNSGIRDVWEVQNSMWWFKKKLENVLSVYHNLTIYCVIVWIMYYE